MKNSIVRFFLLTCFAVATAAASVNPTSPAKDFRTMTPENVGAILAEQGLQVVRYSAAAGEKTYRGSSFVKPIGVGHPARNTLTFFLVGENTHVSRLELVLSINSIQEAPACLDEFSIAAAVLLANCGDNPRVVKILNSARRAQNGTWSIARGGVLLNRIDRPAGDGYELRLTIL